MTRAREYAEAHNCCVYVINIKFVRSKSQRQHLDLPADTAEVRFCLALQIHHSSKGKPDDPSLCQDGKERKPLSTIGWQGRFIGREKL